MRSLLDRLVGFPAASGISSAQDSGDLKLRVLAVFERRQNLRGRSRIDPEVGLAAYPVEFVVVRWSERAPFSSAMY